MRLTKNAKILWIDVLLLCAMCYLLGVLMKNEERREEYQITPLTSVSQDVWYEDNYIFILSHDILLQNQYELSSSLQADVADNAGIETLEIYRRKAAKDTADGIVIVRDDSGKILTVMSSCSTNDNRNMIYLYEKDDNTMLMTFHINFWFEWICDYQYEIFHLDENNEPALYAGSECFLWTGNYSSDNFPRSWITELEDYFADAALLLSTEENTFRAYSPTDEALSKWRPVLYYDL